MAFLNLRLISLAALLSTAGLAGAEDAWTLRNSGSGRDLNSIIWTGVQFVAVGSGGSILTSPEGASWTARNSGTNYTLTSIIRTGNGLIAAGGQVTYVQTSAILYRAQLSSSDGGTWNVDTARFSILNSLISLNGQVFALGAYQTGLVVFPVYSGSVSTAASATDPWTHRYTAAGPDRMNSMAWSGSLFVAVGAAGTIASSPDGITWTERASGTTQSLQGVAWTGTRFVVVGLGGTVLTSLDGIQWTSQNSGTTLGLLSVAWTGSRLVAAGKQGIILSSTEGIAWAAEASGTTQDLNAVIWTGTGLVAVGRGGTILTYGAAPVSVTAPSRRGETFGVRQTGSRLNVDVPTSMRGPLRAAVYAVGGQKLWEVNVSGSSGTFSTDVSMMAPGAYTLEVKGQGRKSAQPFRISH